MNIERKENAFYIIKCDNCGMLFKQPKSLCKQYGDEYWFNPPVVCPSCNNCSKIIRLGSEFKEISNDNSESLGSIPNNKSYQATKPVVNIDDAKKVKESIPSLSEKKVNILDTIKYVKNINQHVEETARLKEELKTAKRELHDAEEVIVNLNLKNSELHTKISSMELQIAELQALLTDEHNQVMTINKHIAELHKQEAKAQNLVSMLESKKQDLSSQVIELDDEILYQSFGLYKPLYEFASSTQYKQSLAEIRQQQKVMMKNRTAVCSYTSWTVNGSEAQGTKMTKDNIKQILRCFNAECENVIDRVKFNNYESMKSRITRSFEALNKLNDVNMISIEESYLNLKYEELSLAYEYQLKKQEEKEELRILREQQREDARVAKEIEERRREIEKEQQHYENALTRLNGQIEAEKSETRLQFLLEKKKEIEANLVDLDIALREVDYREANQRAGYVYIISNIGAFGDNVFKIGMTRRLDPQERVDELGNASVPFKYDIHAMIFSDDAPKLENALHRAFESKRINAINNRKEFFRVTLTEIAKVVKENHDKTVEFISVPPAQQYRETLKKHDGNKMNKICFSERGLSYS